MITGIANADAGAGQAATTTTALRGAVINAGAIAHPDGDVGNDVQVLTFVVESEDVAGRAERAAELNVGAGTVGALCGRSDAGAKVHGLSLIQERIATDGVDLNLLVGGFSLDVESKSLCDFVPQRAIELDGLADLDIDVYLSQSHSGDCGKSNNSESLHRFYHT